MRRRGRSMSQALCLLALASLSLGGCCNEVEDTSCIEWDQSSTCPSPEAAFPKLGADKVTTQGTFWPAHEYLIGGVHTTEPSMCCYGVTFTVCTKELH